jgi:hypothetical protein
VTGSIPQSFGPHTGGGVRIAGHGAEHGLGGGVVEEGRELLEQSQRPGDRGLWERGAGRQPQVSGRSRGVGGEGGADAELHDLARRGRVGNIEVVGRLTAAERFVGSEVAEHIAPHRHVGEVDDQIGPLGKAHQQPVAVSGGEVDRGSEKPTLVADRPDLDARDLAEVEDEEPGLASVEETEPVAALLHGQVRPGRTVGDHHVPEELGVPDRRDVRGGMYRPVMPSKNSRVFG